MLYSATKASLLYTTKSLLLVKSTVVKGILPDAPKDSEICVGLYSQDFVS